MIVRLDSVFLLYPFERRFGGGGQRRDEREGNRGAEFVIELCFVGGRKKYTLEFWLESFLFFLC